MVDDKSIPLNAQPMRVEVDINSFAEDFEKMHANKTLLESSDRVELKI